MNISKVVINKLNTIKYKKKFANYLLIQALYYLKLFSIHSLLPSIFT